MSDIVTISASRLSERARKYFGGDVQRFEMRRNGKHRFEVRQWPHWGNVRVAAVTHQVTAREAVAEFNRMAACALADGERYA